MATAKELHELTVEDLNRARGRARARRCSRTSSKLQHGPARSTARERADEAAATWRAILTVLSAEASGRAAAKA